MRSHILLTLLSVSLCPSLLPAQIPADWGVMSVIKTAKGSKEGGLAAFSPRKPNAWLPITGLNASLKFQLCGVGAPPPIGANCVLIRSTGRALVVGELAIGRGATCEVHVLPLKGLVVAMKSVASYTLSSNGGSVDQMAWLPDGRIVFVYKAITRAGWPWWGGVGILNLNPKKPKGAFTNVPITNWPAPTKATKRIGNSIAVSADGKTVYLGMFYTQSNALQGEIYSLPITGGSLSLLACIPGFLPSLQMDNDGQIIAATGSRVVRVHPKTGRVTPVTTLMNNAIEVDRLTGNYLVGGQNNNAWGIHTVTPKGAITATVTTNLPTTGILASARSGGLSGIAMRNAVEMYGNSYPGKNRYTWAMYPRSFPGIVTAFPRINTKFPLNVTSSPNPVPGFFVLGAGRANAPTGLGSNLLVWPIFAVIPFSPKTTTTVQLQIPNRVSLKGVMFNVQSFHQEANPIRFPATRGLQVIIL